MFLLYLRIREDSELTVKEPFMQIIKTVSKCILTREFGYQWMERMQALGNQFNPLESDLKDNYTRLE